jgi:hypothetical protein
MESTMGEYTDGTHEKHGLNSIPNLPASRDDSDDTSHPSTSTDFDIFLDSPPQSPRAVTSPVLNVPLPTLPIVVIPASDTPETNCNYHDEIAAATAASVALTRVFQLALAMTTRKNIRQGNNGGRRSYAERANGLVALFRAVQVPRRMFNAAARVLKTAKFGKDSKWLDTCFDPLIVVLRAIEGVDLRTHQARSQNTVAALAMALLYSLSPSMATALKLALDKRPWYEEEVITLLKTLSMVEGPREKVQGARKSRAK